MKFVGFTFLLTAVAVHGDILSDTNPFLRSANPAYSPDGLEHSAGLTNPSYAPFSPADSDFGVQEILTKTPTTTPVYLNIGFDLQYTDNAPASLFTTADSSMLYSSYVGASWKPHIANGWFADVGVSQEFYDFEDSNALDFENGMAYFGVVKNLVCLDDTIFYVRYEYQRLTTGSISESDYSAQRIRTGLQKNLFSTPRQELSAGISAAFDLAAAPDSLERNEYAAELSYTYAFTHALSANVSARSAIWNFDEAGRDDTVHTIGAELSYNLCPNATISTGVVYTKNSSDAPFGLNDSQAWQGGLSLGFNYSF